MENKIKVGITHGDINGIGYEIILKTLEDPRIAEISPRWCMVRPRLRRPTAR